jgi:hypothetical protein
MKNRSLSALLLAGLVAGAGCSEGSTAFAPGNRDDQHPPLNDQTPPTRLCEDFCRKIPTVCREADCVKECLAAAGQRCQVEALALTRCIAYRASVACEAEQLGDGPLVFTATFVGCDADRAIYQRCSDTGPGEGGASGRAGAGGRGPGGRAGDGGTQGDGGTAGDGGMAGDGGTAGDAGAAGMNGAGGAAGVSGMGGVAGSGGDDAGPDGVAGSGGAFGSSGASGSAGTDAGGGTGGSGGQCALPDCTGCVDQCQTCVCNNAGDSGACSLECTPDSGADSGADASGD